jgi:hypothetical protein
MTRSKAALFVAIVLAVATQASAKDVAVPNIDLEKVCRAAEGAMNDIYGAGTANDFDSCMNDEKAAREQLVKDWATFSTSDKALCVQPMDYLPSYVEWLTCAEMQRDVRQMRKDQSSSSSPGPRTPR